MGPETTTYVTNIVVCTLLAILMTYYWMRHEHSSSVRYWMFAAWIMTVADILFAVRPWTPPVVGRIAPTLLVTVGHGLLYLAAQQTAGFNPQVRRVAAIVALHGAGLVAFFLIDRTSAWRTVFNGVIWAGMSFASLYWLSKGNRMFWKPAVSPGMAFLAHGLFHVARLSLAGIFEVFDCPRCAAMLQIVGDLEVSFFMIALFASLLIAHLLRRNEELSKALAEVNTLSGLLPICAWCKKIRDDDGYWNKVEDYFSSRSKVEFTHGICAECSERELKRRIPPLPES
jgi:hypothetical protein